MRRRLGCPAPDPPPPLPQHTHPPACHPVRTCRTRDQPSASALQRLTALAAKSAAQLRELLQHVLSAPRPAAVPAVAPAANGSSSGASLATNKKEKKNRKHQAAGAGAGGAPEQPPLPLLQQGDAAACAAAVAAVGAAVAAAASPAPPRDWQALFAPRLEDFDVLLLLRKEALPLGDLGIGASLSASLTAPPRQLLQLAAGPASGPDALSGAAEAPLEPPPKRARAFLRAFPDQVRDVPPHDGRGRGSRRAGGWVVLRV